MLLRANIVDPMVIRMTLVTLAVVVQNGRSWGGNCYEDGAVYGASNITFNGRGLYLRRYIGKLDYNNW